MTVETQFFKKTRTWASDKGIYKSGDPKTQALKLVEEFGEYYEAFIDNNLKEKKDAIGDQIVVMINLSYMYGMNLEDIYSFSKDFGLPELNSNPRLILPIYVGRLCKYVLKEDVKEIKTNLALICRSLEYLAEETGSKNLNCLELAYNEIKNRKGVMKNGNFVKDS